MSVTPQEQAALDRYTAMIAAHYPPHLAAAIAAQYYATALTSSPPPLPLLRQIVSDVADTDASIRREAGRFVVALDRRLGIT
jgi:hypothetical protein